MNEEREDTELAELLKQLPAPARLDDARRAAIFAALPEGKAPRKASFSWSRLVRVAALLVLVGGVLSSLLFPAMPGATKKARKLQAAHEASMRMSDGDSTYMGGAVVHSSVELVESDEGLDLPLAPQAANLAVFSSPVGAAEAPPPSLPAAAPAADATRIGDKPMDPDAFAAALSERGPEIAPSESVEPSPAVMSPVIRMTSPIVMRGIVGTRSPGQRGKALALPAEAAAQDALDSSKGGALGIKDEENKPAPTTAPAKPVTTYGRSLSDEKKQAGDRPMDRARAPEAPMAGEAIDALAKSASEPPSPEVALKAAKKAEAVAERELAEAIDSDGYGYDSGGLVEKAKRLDAPERRLRAEEQEKQLASIARKADETLKMDQRESQSAILAELAKLENPRRELLDEYRKSRQKDLAKELPAVGSEAVDGADKEVLVEEPVEELKMIAVKPAPVDFGPFTLIPTAEHPLSTFGLDVDSAGYSRAVSLIDEGARPEPATIRQEEFINAFDYGDLAPAEATFRVYLEGAASPFRPGNHLLRVGVKGRRLGREEQRPLRLTILLDASGSMETPERMALAKQAVRALLATLSPDDTVTLLTCSDRTRRIFSRSGWGTDEAAREAETALGGIRCQGATNLEDGIVRAFESASADFAPKAENRVVILSDGIANLGSANAEEILAKVAANRDRGINCSVIGVGRSTYNDALLEAMANRGNGQYRFLDSEASIHESFVEDLQNSFNTIAADVKIQVEWNSAAVQAYRSHGYDSRALKDEQFRDDSVDAGEVGSGQGVTVVYEMQLAEGLKPGATLGTVRIRYRRIDTGAVEEIEAPIAAEAVQRDFVRARSQFRLASAVAEFATVLKHVPPAAQANALQPVAAEAVRVAAELDYYAPARGFADAVLKLMTLGL